MSEKEAAAWDRGWLAGNAYAIDEPFDERNARKGNPYKPKREATRTTPVMSESERALREQVVDERVVKAALTRKMDAKRTQQRILKKVMRLEEAYLHAVMKEEIADTMVRLEYLAAGIQVSVERAAIDRDRIAALAYEIGVRVDEQA
jgi:hypothetical protein